MLLLKTIKIFCSKKFSIIVLITLFTVHNSNGQRFSFDRMIISYENGLNLSKIKFKENSGGNPNLESKRTTGYNFTLKALVIRDVYLGAMFGIEYKQTFFNSYLKTNQLQNLYSNNNEYVYNIDYSLSRFGITMYAPFFQKKRFGAQFNATIFYNKLSSYKVIANSHILNVSLYDFINIDKAKFSTILSLGVRYNPNKKTTPFLNIGYEFNNSFYLRYTDAVYKNDNIFFNIGLQFKLYKPEE